MGVWFGLASGGFQGSNSHSKQRISRHPIGENRPIAAIRLAHTCFNLNHYRRSFLMRQLSFPYQD